MVKMLYAVMAAVLLSLTSQTGAARAQATSKIDFEELPEGMIVNEVSLGSGVSGDGVSGSIGVRGDTPDPAITTNAAILFDATCTGGCTGDDTDLEKPELGNVLIMALDLTDSDGNGLVDDPNDSDLVDSVFEFDFSRWGSETVTVISGDIMDVESDESGGRFELFSGGPGGTRLATVPIPVTGNNGLTTVPVGVSGVDFMAIILNGSGAVDNIVIARPFCGDGYVDTSVGEECDDGNTEDGDCCSSTCQLEPEGTCCDDGNPCTITSTCNDAGVCEVEGVNIFPCPVGVVEADVTADSAEPDGNLGSRAFLEVDADAPTETFLRVSVNGLAGRSVPSARLRLTVSNVSGASSRSGGRIHVLADCTWGESTLTWNTRPTIIPTVVGPVLGTHGAVSSRDVVEFDVTSAIQHDGVYCFLMDSLSSNSAKYNSREAQHGRPELLIDVGCECGTPPPPVCGNGEVETGEECDDGNTEDGDCCSADCAFEPIEAPCQVGDNACATGQCNGCGICDDVITVTCPGPSGPCDGGQSCNPETGACEDVPDVLASTPCPDTDGNPCTVSGCDGAGSCDQNHLMAPESSACADTDGNGCTTAGCDGAGNCDQHHAPTPASQPCADTDANDCTTAGCDGAGDCDQTHILEPVGTFCERNGECDIFGKCEIPPPPEDHFKCYKTRQLGSRFPERELTLEDQFTTTHARVLAPRRFCNPVDKNGEGIDDPTAHMLCYKLTEPQFQRRDVVVENQFGEQTLRVMYPYDLCVPAEKDGVPSELNMNHFKCYRVAQWRPRFTEREVTLEDQFETRVTILRRPRLLCNPVDKNGEGIVAPGSHLTCYSIRDAAGQPDYEPREVQVLDQFGEVNLNTLRGDCRKRSYFCVPSTKRLAGETTTTTSTTTTSTATP